MAIKELTIKKMAGEFKNNNGEDVKYEKIQIQGFDGILDTNITDKSWVKSILKYKKDHPEDTIVIKGQI